MKRKTRNTCLLEVIKRQEKEMLGLHAQITALKQQEQVRDAAWAKHSDERIRDINIQIRRSS